MRAAASTNSRDNGSGALAVAAEGGLMDDWAAVATTRRK